jgi:hypothetical protein
MTATDTALLTAYIAMGLILFGSLVSSSTHEPHGFPLWLAIPMALILAIVWPIVCAGVFLWWCNKLARGDFP